MLPRLGRMSADKTGMRKLVPTLRKMGIRLEFVPHLPRTRIDGGTFWLDSDSPVVAISLRYDRIDSFWFTLMHELAHVRKGHGKVGFLDSDLVGKDAQRPEEKPRYEQDADRAAARWLIPQDRLRKFIGQTKPYYSAAKLRHFADELGVHPAIVVGQLQYRGEITWGHLRNMLEKASPLLGID